MTDDMALRALHLYWTAGTEDVNLGRVWHDAIPRVGELIPHVTDHGGIWRVVTVYHAFVVEEGSPRWREHAEGRPAGPQPVTLFVVPAQGPFRE
jgi:hypothetical protein